jgi:hypothetical protein
MRNRIALLASALLIVGLLAGLTTSASAGSGDPGATAAKKKKKKVCPAGTHKVVVKKKNGKKKKTCVPNALPGPTAPTPTATTLTISPATFAYPDVDHGTCSAPPDADCVEQAFTVTNTSGAASGVPATTLVETQNPIPGDPPGFVVSTNTCTAALAPGGTCTVTAYFKPTSNAGDANYASVLHVVATPGGDAQATLSGHAT